MLNQVQHDDLFNDNLYLITTIPRIETLRGYGGRCETLRGDGGVCVKPCGVTFLF